MTRLAASPSTALRPALRAALSVVLCLSAASVQADPMRPFTLPAAASAALGVGARATVEAQRADLVTARPAGELFAIRQDSRGRREVLMGERWLGVGDRIDKSLVSAVGANSVEFSRGKLRATLYLLPPLQGHPRSTP